MVFTGANSPLSPTPRCVRAWKWHVLLNCTCNENVDTHVSNLVRTKRFKNNLHQVHHYSEIDKTENKAFRKARTTGKPSDKKRYQKLNSSCQKNIRAVQDNYMRDIISPDAAKNPKKFWSFIKGKKQESSGVAPLRHTDGTLHSNPHTKADILNCQLKSVFTKEDMSSMPDKGDSPHNTVELKITEKHQTI